MIEATTKPPRSGQLALQYCKKYLPVQVLRSNAGYYIGTFDDQGPVSRESAEYWRSQLLAQRALDTGNWTQKQQP